jgi:hypothetical protein
MKLNVPVFLAGSRLNTFGLALAAGLVLSGLLCGCGAKPAPLYSIRMEHLKATFFTDQKLQEVVSLPQPTPGAPQAEAWELLGKAAEEEKEGKMDQVKQSLNALLGQTNVETRLHLWAWAALRRLGASPEPAAAEIVRGLVLEAPAGQGVDTTAVYADGTVRSINNSEAVTVVEKPSPRIQELVKKLLSEGQSQLADAPSVTNRPPLVLGETRLTLLTFGGNHARTQGGPQSGKWKLPDEITQDFSQLQQFMLEDVMVKPKPAATP